MLWLRYQLDHRYDPKWTLGEYSTIIEGRDSSYGRLVTLCCLVCILVMACILVCAFMLILLYDSSQNSLFYYCFIIKD